MTIRPTSPIPPGALYSPEALRPGVSSALPLLVYLYDQLTPGAAACAFSLERAAAEIGGGVAYGTVRTWWRALRESGIFADTQQRGRAGWLCTFSAAWLAEGWSEGAEKGADFSTAFDAPSEMREEGDPEAAEILAAFGAVNPAPEQERAEISAGFPPSRERAIKESLSPDSRTCESFPERNPEEEDLRSAAAPAADPPAATGGPGRRSLRGNPSQRARSVLTYKRLRGGPQSPPNAVADQIAQAVPDNAPAEEHSRWAAIVEMQLRRSKPSVVWMVQRFLEGHDDRPELARLQALAATPRTAPPAAARRQAGAPAAWSSAPRPLEITIGGGLSPEELREADRLAAQLRPAAAAD